MNDEKLKVNEIFFSIDGEGKRAGELAAFIRLTGCNLRCSYCDTVYAFHNGEFLTPQEIAEQVKDYHNITLTGGEPLLQKPFTLIELLKNHSLNIETNGSIDISPYLKYPQVFFTLDYKCGASGEENKMLLKNFSLLRPQDVLKFVVANEDDLTTALKICRQIKSLGKKYISPVFGKIEPKNIVEFMKNNKTQNWKLQIQLHKVIWKPTTKGV